MNKNIIDTQLVAVGTYMDGEDPILGYLREDGPIPLTGAIEDGYFAALDGARIDVLAWYSETSSITLAFAGALTGANAKWSCMTINGVPFYRADADFNTDTNTSFGFTGVTENPFGPEGNIATINFN